MPARRASRALGHCPTISAFACWACLFQRRTASRSRTACVRRSQRAPPKRSVSVNTPATLLLQRLTQQLAGAMQACAHGLRLQTQEKSGFLDAHLLDVAHDKHDAVVLGQAADRSFQEPADIRKRSGLFGTELVSTGRSSHSFKGLRCRRSGRLCRRRPSASFSAMRVSQVESRASARNSDRCVKARI